MKLSKLIRKVRTLLDASERKKLKHQDELKHLLKKMRSKEKHLVRKHEAQGHDRKRLEHEIALLHEQRKKGLRTLKRLDQ